MKNLLLIGLLFISMREIQAQSSNGNTNTVKKIYEAFNAHDWQKMLSYYSSDAIFEDPSFEKAIQDKNYIETHHRELQNYFPDIADEIKSIFACDNTVVVEFTATGTSANGEKFTLPICTIFTFKNGKVIRDATYYDVKP